MRDRCVVEVDADELRVRERLRHQHRRSAVAAADVGDLGAALELGDDAVERRQPLARPDWPCSRAGRTARRRRTGNCNARPSRRRLPVLNACVSLRLVGDRPRPASRTRRSCRPGSPRRRTPPPAPATARMSRSRRRSRRSRTRPAPRAIRARSARACRSAAASSADVSGPSDERAIQPELVADEHERGVRRRAELVHHLSRARARALSYPVSWL